jgi:hypothetical protein
MLLLTLKLLKCWMKWTAGLVLPAISTSQKQSRQT